jgi:hypothetical protein
MKLPLGNTSASGVRQGGNPFALGATDPVGRRARTKGSFATFATERVFANLVVPTPSASSIRDSVDLAMALPGGRAITVDGKGYQWIVKKDKRSSRDSTDDWGDDERVYDRVVTIKANAGGPVVQYREDSAVTPEGVAKMIRAAVERKQLGPKGK